MEPWFSKDLIKWYQINKRDLPWRHQKNAYFIWLSEIILQQTQVAQGLAYYNRFTQTFPSVKHLAQASEDEVLKLWQGLGYYSRARNLHATAKVVHDQHMGVFPSSYETIRSLKGIGDYTSAAIASFAFDQPYAVVDGNVYRVLSRIFGIETPIDTSAAKKEFQNLANELLNKKEPALHNQAIMEFGSQYCRPVNPDCENCIFRHKCYAYNNGKVAVLPIKIKKIKTRNRYFNYVVLVDKNKKVLINRRGENDIWQGLYDFLLVETPTPIETDELLNSKPLSVVIGKDFSLLHASGQYKHILSHQHLYAKFYVIKLKGLFKKSQTTIALEDLENLAYPRLIEKFMNDCTLKDLF